VTVSGRMEWITEMLNPSDGSAPCITKEQAAQLMTGVDLTAQVGAPHGYGPCSYCFRWTEDCYTICERCSGKERACHDWEPPGTEGTCASWCGTLYKDGMAPPNEAGARFMDDKLFSQRRTWCSAACRDARLPPMQDRHALVAYDIGGVLAKAAKALILGVTRADIEAAIAADDELRATQERIKALQARQATSGLAFGTAPTARACYQCDAHGAEGAPPLCPKCRAGGEDGAA
jgi:hypothetical protein